MKNNFYKILFLALFINILTDNKNAIRIPKYISNDYNKKFLKGIV